MSRRIRFFCDSVYEEKNSDKRILPCRDMRTMKFQPHAAEALDLIVAWSKSIVVEENRSVEELSS